MNEMDFMRKGGDRWQRLRFLSRKAEKSPGRMGDQEVLEAIGLHRQVIEDLSKARTETANQELIENLNSLSGQSYSAMYRLPSRGALSYFIDFFEAGAIAFRRQFKFILASLLMLLVGISFSVLLLKHRPDVRGYVISPEEETLFDHWKEAEFEQRNILESSTMWSFYATNNPMVAIRAAGMGASTFGIGSGWLMWRTGIQLGALGYEMNSVGKLPFLLSSLAPHGATELTGAVVAGATGMLFGWALIRPGRRTRGQALRESARDGFALFLMGVIMMYIAAPFEAYFSFRPDVDQGLKAVVGTFVFTLWVLYWGFVGRKTQARQDAATVSAETRALEAKLPPIAAKSATDSAAS